MAISAKFIADFSSFQTAVEKAEVSLKSFQTGAGNVEKSLNRMANALSGQKIISEATLAAAAVEKIGGTSKLTQSELQRVGATATEAAAKMKAMGMEVPPGIQKIADAAKQIPPQLSMADKAAGLLKSTFAQFTAAGLATSAIQGLISGIGQFVEIGKKLPAMETSFRRLSTSMGQDSATMLSNMKVATSGLVSNFDIMSAANKAMLLGLPVTSQAMGELAKTATVLGKAMGQDATASLNDLITALGRSSPMILDNLGLTVKVGEANEAYAAKMGIVGRELTDAEKKMAFYDAAMEAARKKTKELGEQTQTLGEILQSTWTSFGDKVSSVAGIVNVGVGKILTDWRSLIDVAGDALASGAGGAGIGAALARQAAMGGPKETPQDVHLLTPAQEKALADAKRKTEEAAEAAKRLKKAQEDAKRAAEAWAGSIRDLRGELSGAALQEDVTRLTEAVKGLSAEQLKSPTVIARIAKDAQELHEKGAKLTPILNDILGPVTALAKVDLNIGARGFFATIRADVEALTDLALKIPEGGLFSRILGPIPGLDPSKLGLKISEGGLFASMGTPGKTGGLMSMLFGDSKQFGGQLASTIMGAIQGGGNVIGSAGSLLGSTMMGGLAKTLTSGAGMALSGALGGAVNAILPGLGALLGPLADGIAKWFGGLFKNKTEEAINKSFGSYDTLREKLLVLGAEGERLWVELTQRTGKGDTSKAARIIDEINRKLDEHNQKQGEAAQAAEDASAKQQAALDAISSKYTEALGKLTQEYDSLAQQVAEEAPEEFMGLIETQQRARMAQIATEKAALELQREAELAAQTEKFDAVLEAGKTTDQKLRDLFTKPYEIPVTWKYPNGIPTGGGPIPMASGGDFLVRKPTLFLAGEAGPERATFRRAGGGGGTIRQPVQINLGGRRFLETVIEIATEEGAA